MDKKILEKAQSNLAIFDSLVKADSVINNPKYKSIICSISGGADSDVMMDLIYKVDTDKKVKYVFIDTGLEYEATKKQIEYDNYNDAVRSRIDAEKKYWGEYRAIENEKWENGFQYS